MRGKLSNRVAGPGRTQSNLDQQYLDAVYSEHDLGMTYTFILWAVIGGILLLWLLGRKLFPLSRVTTPSKQQLLEESRPRQTTFYRLGTSIRALSRRHLLRETVGASIFGHTTRLQVLILAILIAYLTIFTFVGITYKTWVTPVKGSPGVYNTRTGLGPWSDRIGVLAFALTPLSVLLACRESLLSLITGVPYHHFMFLHRWLGYIIFIQSALHTLGWTIIEARLYQPQPDTWNSWIAQLYIIWGIVAMILLSIMVTFSTQWGIRLTGYEFFRKSHYVLAMVYIGACWGHWAQLYCWMIASLLVWVFDRGVRLVRTFCLHHLNLPHSSSSFGIHVPQARMTLFPHSHDGDVVRLDFEHNHDEWKIGQHFFLTFPALTIWQSHPMTPCSLPGQNPRGQSHTYLIRARKGMTKSLAQLAQATKPTDHGLPTTSVVLSGPYGQDIVGDDFYHDDEVNLFFVAGGTGVTFILPPLLALASTSLVSRRGLTELVWVIRRREDLKWIEPELHQLRQAAAACSNFRIRVFVTRGAEENPCDEQLPTTTAVQDSKEVVAVESLRGPSSLSSSPSSPTMEMKDETFAVVDLSSRPSHHPDLAAQVREFVDRSVAGPTRVIASGPLTMVSDLRTAVAELNSPQAVWRGEERYNVELVHDDRLEY